MGEKRKNSSPTHIGTVLQDVLKTCGRESDAKMLEIWQHWKSAVPENVAENAQPAAVKAGLLLVHVTSPVWLHQLRFLKKQIIADINLKLGCRALTDIKFKIGR